MNGEKTGDKERKPDLDVKGSRCFLHERFKELNSSTHTLLSCHVRRRPEEKSDKKKSSNQFSFYPSGCFTLCYQHVNESFLYLPARVYMYLRTSLPQVSIYSLKSVTPGRRSLLCAWVTLSVWCVGVLYLFFSLTQVGHQRICCRLECVAWCHPILPSPH